METIHLDQQTYEIALASIGDAWEQKKWDWYTFRLTYVTNELRWYY